MSTNPFQSELTGVSFYEESDDMSHTIEEMRLIDATVKGQTNYLGFIGMMLFVALSVFMIFYATITIPEDLTKSITKIIGVLNR